MDNLSHFLFGYFLFSGKVSTPLILLFTNIPDITAIFHRIYYSVIKDKRTTVKKFLKWKPNKEYLKIYRTSHSLFFVLGLGLILFFLTENYLILTLCMISHLALDIITHSGEWGTRIFYPFSDFHIDAFNWFKDKNYTIIIFMMIILMIIIKFGLV